MPSIIRGIVYLIGAPFELGPLLSLVIFLPVDALLGRSRGFEKPIERCCSGDEPNSQGHNKDHPNSTACSEIEYFLHQHNADC